MSDPVFPVAPTRRSLVRVLRHGLGLSAVAVFEERPDGRHVLAVLEGAKGDALLAEGDVAWDLGLAAGAVSGGRPQLLNSDTPRPSRVPYSKKPRTVGGAIAAPAHGGLVWADRADGPILQREFDAVVEAVEVLATDRRRAREAAEADARARVLGSALEGVRAVLDAQSERDCLAALVEAAVRETNASDVLIALTAGEQGECVVVGGVGGAARALVGRPFDAFAGLVGLAIRSGAAVPTTARWLPSMKWVLGEGADLAVAPGDPVLVHPIQLGRDPLGALVLVRGDLDGEGVVHGVRTCCEAAALLVHQFRLREAVARDAMYDGLTALYNRPAFMKQLAGSIAFCRRYKADLALLMVDADHFKRVNDEHGHLAGDVALRFISDTVRRALREYDFAGRYGGEEIAVALPHTDSDGAVTVAERIRALVEAATVPAGSARLRLTVSIGVGALTGTMRACEDLIAVADAALYAAKDGGRNRVVVG